jgi:outer membrane protein TolC
MHDAYKSIEYMRNFIYACPAYRRSHIFRCKNLAAIVFYLPMAICLPAIFPADAADLTLSEVVLTGLQQNLDIHVQEKQIEIASAQEQQANGKFDWTLSSGLNDTRTTVPPTDSVPEVTTVTTGYQAGMSKLLENGITVNANATANSVQSNVQPIIPKQNLVSLGVGLTVPLLKGSGPETVRVSLDVAKMGVVQSQYDLRSQVAKSLRDIIQAYWNYRTQAALLAVAAKTQERSSDLLESNKKLVDAAEKPRGDLVLLKADLADKMAAHQAAILALSESRKALGRLLGMDLAASEQLPEPSDPFPTASNSISALAQKIEPLNALALSLRPELKSLDTKLAVAHRQLTAATKNLRPQLDLNVGVSYGTASEFGSRFGFIAEPGRAQTAPSVFATLNYQFPVENNQATGAVREVSALGTQLEIQQHDLKDGVKASVDTAVQTLVRTAEQLQVAQEGLELYEQAVKQEITKQRNGISTLIDVINVEGRFVAAQVNFLQLQLAYSNALADLRFQTGTFFIANAEGETATDHLDLNMSDLGGLGPLASFISESRASPFPIRQMIK